MIWKNVLYLFIHVFTLCSSKEESWCLWNFSKVFLYQLFYLEVCSLWISFVSKHFQCCGDWTSTVCVFWWEKHQEFQGVVAGTFHMTLSSCINGQTHTHTHNNKNTKLRTQSQDLSHTLAMINNLWFQSQLIGCEHKSEGHGNMWGLKLSCYWIPL